MLSRRPRSPAAAGEGTMTDARAIGQVGAAARVAGGVAAIVLPIALSGITWWDVVVALAVLPLTAVAAAAAIGGGAPHGPAAAWVRSSVVLVVVLATQVVLTYATPLNGGTAAWLFVGVSLLIAAVHGDGGCEAIAIPNALARRRDATGCVIYAPIDGVEARRVVPRGTGAASSSE